jgi:serine/threonine protein kinase
MTIEHTQHQSPHEQEHAQALSLKRMQPPTQIVGYEMRRFLGAGAFGEVWVAIDRTTGRQVAIKFYAHRGGLDWSLLSREVEKLAFLSADRYVVQLLDVGWDAEPPYYVMEFLEQGSLEERLRKERRIAPREAVSLFRDVATGLLHAHAKGVLHCDLKPANVLLDQDHRPRLADFGQSRLTSEQTPALGTLFYMAPEQADLSAVPDVRWDVYALGALLYCMLTGSPPHKSDATVTEIETSADLELRLSKYRELLRESPLPTAHRHVSGVDRDLADLVDHCLAANPNERYPNVQSVLDAIEGREHRLARRTMAVLGTIGPAIVLAAMSLFIWWSFTRVINESDRELRDRWIKTDQLTAKYIASDVKNQLENRYQKVEDAAQGHRLQRVLGELCKDADLAQVRKVLSDAKVSNSKRESLQGVLLENEKRQELQQLLDDELKSDSDREAAWFITDENGLQLARSMRHQEQQTIGLNYAWRQYFSGEPFDRPEDWRPDPNRHITSTTLTGAFRSTADGRWHVAVSTPIFSDGPQEKFLGVIGRAMELGQLFLELQDVSKGGPLAALIDLTPGPTEGVILQHPLYKQLLAKDSRLPDWVLDYRLEREARPAGDQRSETYRDPLGKSPAGAAFDHDWLAAYEPVPLRGGETGWIVVVQSSYDETIGKILRRLESTLWSGGVLAGIAMFLLTLLWVAVIRSLVGRGGRGLLSVLPRQNS